MKSARTRRRPAAPMRAARSRSSSSRARAAPRASGPRAKRAALRRRRSIISETPPTRLATTATPRPSLPERTGAGSRTAKARPRPSPIAGVRAARAAAHAPGTRPSPPAPARPRGGGIRLPSILRRPASATSRRQPARRAQEDVHALLIVHPAREHHGGGIRGPAVRAGEKAALSTPLGTTRGRRSRSREPRRDPEPRRSRRTHVGLPERLALQPCDLVPSEVAGPGPGARPGRRRPRGKLGVMGGHGPHATRGGGRPPRTRWRG